MALHAWIKRRGWFTILTVTCAFVVVVISGIVMCVLNVHSEAYERRRDFQSALRTILQFAHEDECDGIPGSCYSNWNSEFPNGDEVDVMYSWRFKLMPWMDHIGEASGIPNAWDERWDSATNQRITERGYGVVMRSGRSRFASIFGFVGEDAAFCERQIGNEPGKRRKPKDVPPDLLLIIAVNQTAVEWNQPGDIRAMEFEGIRRGTTLAEFALCRGDTWVGFADGEMWLLSRHTPLSEIAKFCRIPHAAKYDREAVLSKYRIDSYVVGI